MQPNVEDRPQHPVYGRALSGSTRMVEGVAFYPYRSDVCRYIYVSHDSRIAVRGRDGTRYTAIVDGAALPRAFRKFDTAARAGVAATQADRGV